MKETRLPARMVNAIKSGSAWKWFAALAGLVIVLYLLPIPRATQETLLGIFGWLTFAALVVGLVIWRPVPRWGWLMLALSQLMYALGDVLRALPGFGFAQEVGEFSGTMYLVGSLCFLVAMPLIYWHFRHLVRRENLAEGLILGLGFALVGWIVVISPNLAGLSASGDWFDAIVYPAFLIGLVFFASLFLLTPLGALWSFRLLLGVVAGLLASEYLTTLVAQGTIPALLGPYGLGDIVSVAALACLGIAYLHPSFGMLKQLKPRETSRSLNWVELLALALAFAAAPTIWLLQSAETIPLNTAIVIVGMIVIFVLVEWRLVQLFQTVKLQNQELRALDKLKSEFLANMTHELRTPLNSIINFSRFMQDGMYGPVNAEQGEALARVTDAGEHLLSMINDVLDLAKIQAGMVRLFVEPDVSVKEELTVSMDMARGLLENKSVHLIQEIPDNLPLIVADRRRIRQIFINLLSNACKFTTAGQVCVSAEQQSENIMVRVQDTGSGIAPDEQAFVFEPFRQAHAGLEQGTGSGLGLPIAKSFVEAHYGKLWFESESNKGTTFYVSLPISAPELERIAHA